MANGLLRATEKEYARLKTDWAGESGPHMQQFVAMHNARLALLRERNPSHTARASQQLKAHIYGCDNDSNPVLLGMADGTRCSLAQGFVGQDQQCVDRFTITDGGHYIVIAYNRDAWRRVDSQVEDQPIIRDGQNALIKHDADHAARAALSVLRPYQTGSLLQQFHFAIPCH